MAEQLERAVLEADIEEISPNFQTEFDEFWNINNLKNDFQNPNSTYFVAKLDNEIVGFAGKFLVFVIEGLFLLGEH